MLLFRVSPLVALVCRKGPPDCIWLVQSHKLQMHPDVMLHGHFGSSNMIYIYIMINMIPNVSTPIGLNPVSFSSPGVGNTSHGATGGQERDKLAQDTTELGPIEGFDMEVR